MIQKPTNQLFADVPLFDDPKVTAYLQELNDKLNRSFQTFNAPGLITGVTAVATGTRVLIQWNSDSASSLYRVFRNSTGDFSTAAVVASVGASKTGVRQLSAQDVNDITIPELFYWVQGVNERGQAGAPSAMQTVVNFETAGTTKTLPDSIATDLFYFDGLSTGETASVLVQYTVTVTDGGAGRQIATGIRAFNIYNAGSLVSANAQIGSELNTVTGGTLVLTWAVTGTGPGPAVRVTSTSSLAFDATIYYAITNNSDQTIVFL